MNIEYTKAFAAQNGVEPKPKKPTKLTIRELLRPHVPTIAVGLIAVVGEGVANLLEPWPLDGASGARIRASLHDAEREHPINLAVNQIYPEGFALPSPPPTLLLDLPKLPTELEYRIIGRQFVLRDAAANLILDCMPEALPAPPTGP